MSEALLIGFGIFIIGIIAFYIYDTFNQPIKIGNKQKDIDWFKKKYIKNKKNLKYFVNQLSPSDMEKIIKASFKRLDFNWNEDGFFDEDSLKKVSSIWDAIDEMDNDK